MGRRSGQAEVQQLSVDIVILPDIANVYAYLVQGKKIISYLRYPTEPLSRADKLLNDRTKRLSFRFRPPVFLHGSIPFADVCKCNPQQKMEPGTRRKKKSVRQEFKLIIFHGLEKPELSLLSDHNSCCLMNIKLGADTFLRYTYLNIVLYAGTMMKPDEFCSDKFPYLACWRALSFRITHTRLPRGS
jgi:hypothetical protein